MLTNLVAAIVVSLATNTTERFPQHQVSDPTPSWLASRYGVVITPAVYCFHMENDADPQEKWVKTTVKRLEVATFDCFGRSYSVTNETVLDEHEVHYSKAVNWEMSPSIQHPRPEGGVIIFTNSSINGSLTITNK